MVSMKPRRFIFFPSFQPVFNSTSNLDTERVSSYYGCRYQAVNLVDLLSRSSNNIDSTHSCRNSLNHLDTKRISSCYGCRYQAVNLVDLLIHSSNIIDSTHSCRNSSNHLDTKRISNYYGCRYQAVNLVDLLIHSSNIIDSTHSCRNSSNHLNTTRVSSYQSLKHTNNLHNLSYVTLFFVISLTDCIFDAFNCWNHCIFQVLCVRHWHIFSCTTADWCIQIVKCF